MKTPNLRLLKQRHLAFKRKAVLDADMLYSEAFTSLGKTSIFVLLRFLQKRTWDPKDRRKNKTYHNSGLVFTYGEAALLGISPAQFKRSINEIIENGFLEIEHQGGQFGNGRDYSRYKLIDEWKRYGTKDFRLREKKRVVRYSSGFKYYNEKRTKAKQFCTVKNDYGPLSKMTT